MTWWQWIIVIHVSMEVGAMLLRKIFGRNNKTWKGGNGCNLLRIFGFKSPCCIGHDHDYKAGGWYIARWSADLRLISCMWKQGFWGKLLAVPMLIGVRAGGMITFQYGKKRFVPYPSVT